MRTKPHVGPTFLASDPPFARRLRFHQAWYRAHILDLPRWGTTPGGRELGSILDVASAAAGMNFTSRAAKDAYVNRKPQGWGVDPTRTLGHMTSSQALMFNLFGPLTDRPEWLAATVSRLLGRTEPLVVERVEFEHSPRPLGSYLNDRTLLDVVVWFSSARGPELLVFEVKLADRFSSRRVRFDRNPRYRELNEAFPLWRSPLTSLVDTRFNQLARVHALAAQIAALENPEPRRCTVVVLHHPTDAGTPRTVDAYRAHLYHGEVIRALSLPDMLDAADPAAAAAANESQIVAELRARYLDLDRSAALFAEASSAPGFRLGHSNAPV